MYGLRLPQRLTVKSLMYPTVGWITMPTMAPQTVIKRNSVVPTFAVGTSCRTRAGW